MKNLIVGNWKMYPTYADVMVLAASLKEGLERITSLEIALAPPLPWLVSVIESYKPSHSHIGFAVQNIWPDDQGAFTGETSAYLLKKIVKYAIVGHSERRKFNDESNDLIKRKVASCLRWQVRPILCVGERQKVITASGLNRVEWDRLTDQLLLGLESAHTDNLDSVVVAYEPVWAIGTSKPATAEYAEEVTEKLSALLVKERGKAAEETRFLYGGSVNGANAASFVRGEKISGLLVGGASVKANEFITICQTVSKVR